RCACCASPRVAGRGRDCRPRHARSRSRRGAARSRRVPARWTDGALGVTARGAALHLSRGHDRSDSMLRLAWLILRKDLTVEVRSGEIAYTTLFFAVACILIFAFALVREGRAPEDGAAGILWIAVMFAGN